VKKVLTYFKALYMLEALEVGHIFGLSTR